MKITVLSSGSWGTALAKTLCDNNHEVHLWSRSQEYSDAMEEKRENFRYLPGFALPDSLHLTADLAKAIENTDLIVTSTPTQYVRHSLEMLKEHKTKAPICNVSKGIEVSSLKRISEITSEILGESHPFCVLVGPSHAEELIKNMPTAVVVSSQFNYLAKMVQNAFMNQNFRVYTSSDLVGVELGGALKNIFAIAAGVIDGLGLGDNTKAALMTRGNVEMARLGRALGGFEETFNGLSGIGDLIVTCTSKHSRNRSVGEMLGKGLSMDDIKAKLGHSVAEGVATTKSAYQLAQQHKVEVPIIEQCYQVLYEDRSAAEAINYLMTRDAKQERN